VGALRQRLSWTDNGALHDGPRRYLMMRTDVLMGTLQRLPLAQQQAWLQAFAASTQEHGGASLHAYAQMVGADAEALINSTVQAAADLGWGRWAVTPSDGGFQVQVFGSPFVHGWRAAQSAHTSSAMPAGSPCCAPISGLLTALGGLLWQGPAEVQETACAAQHAAPHDQCHFSARRVAP
jgi:uncharacterized protein